MRAMAIETFAGLRSRMGHLRGFNRLSLLSVAGHAKRLGVSLRQYNLAVFRGGVADLALLLGEWRMRELRHQLGRR